MGETREDTDPGQLHVITAMRTGETVRYSLTAPGSPDSLYSLTQTGEGYVLTTRDGETVTGFVALLRAHSAVAESPYSAWALPSPSRTSPGYRQLVAALRLAKTVEEHPVSPGGLHRAAWEKPAADAAGIDLLMKVHLAWDAGVSESDIAEIVHVPVEEVKDTLRPYQQLKADAAAKAQEGPEYLTLQVGPDGEIAGVGGPPPEVTGEVPRAVRAGPVSFQADGGTRVVRCPECGAAAGLLFAQLPGDPAVRAWCPDRHGWTTELSGADYREMLKLAFPDQD